MFPSKPEREGKGMTIADLRKRIEDLPEDMPVVWWNDRRGKGESPDPRLERMVIDGEDYRPEYQQELMDAPVLKAVFLIQ